MPDNYQTRRSIIITVIVILVLFVGYGFYRLLTSGTQGLVPRTSPQAPVGGSVGKSPVIPTTPDGVVVTPLPSPTAGLEPKIKEQVLLPLTDFSVVSPVINKNQDRVFLYKKDGGGLYNIDFSGNKDKLSSITIVGLIDAIWSPIRDRASVFYLDSEVLKSFLHIGTSSVVSLPRDIKSFSWSPDGKQFAYLIENNDEEISLFISDASGKNTRETFKTPIRDAQIQWISADKIAFQTAPSGQASGFVFLYSIKNGSFLRFLGPRFGLNTRWSPDGTHVLVGSTNGAGHNYIFSLLDAGGVETQKMDFITFPEKCAWVTAREFYCAVPNEFPGNAVLPDDYLRGEVSTQDRILSFSLDTEDTKLVFSGGAMDMDNLAVTQKKDYLIFLNRLDGIPWRLKLTQ